MGAFPRVLREECKEHPDYDGSYMPLRRGCADCYYIWYARGQQRNEDKERELKKINHEKALRTASRIVKEYPQLVQPDESLFNLARAYLEHAGEKVRHEKTRGTGPVHLSGQSGVNYD